MAALFAAHPEPLTLTDVMEATGYFTEEANALVDDMKDEWNLVTATTKQKGSVRTKEIKLTPLGLRVAPHYAEIEALVMRKGSRHRESES